MATKTYPWLGSVIGFVLGLMVAGGIGYFAIIVPGDKLARDYQKTNAELTSRYSQLQGDYSGLKATNSDLASQLRDRQNVINKIGSTVDELGNRLDGSADLIQTIIDEISKLSDILRNG